MRKRPIPAWESARRNGIFFLVMGIGVIVARAAGLQGMMVAKIALEGACILGGIFIAAGLLLLAISASPRAADFAVLAAKWGLFAVLLAMIFGTIGLLIMAFLNWPGDV